jgi:hypothetical protein
LWRNLREPVRREGPPTWRDEPPGRVKGTEGKGLQEKKGASAEKLESWMRIPVQPESAMSGEDGRRADTAPNKEGGDVVIGMEGEGWGEG